MWREVAKIAEIAEFTTKERSKRRRTEKIVFFRKRGFFFVRLRYLRFFVVNLLRCLGVVNLLRFLWSAQ